MMWPVVVSNLRHFDVLLVIFFSYPSKCYALPFVVPFHLTFFAHSLGDRRDCGCFVGATLALPSSHLTLIAVSLYLFSR